MDIENYIKKILSSKDPNQKEFHNSVLGLLKSIEVVLEQRPDLYQQKIIDRIIEPDRSIQFKITWSDDRGDVQINRGFRIQMNNCLGPYKGGLRFHSSVNLSIFKYLALEQLFKNSITTLSIGGAMGGSDFESKGKSDNEIMRFCQNYMNELAKHIGPEIDIPSGGIGVGGREIGYLFGSYKKITNKFNGSFSGKNINWGGSVIRSQATGHGMVYFANSIMKKSNENLKGKRCIISGCGSNSLYVAQKLINFGAKVILLSENGGYFLDDQGLDNKKIEFLKKLKNIKRGSLREYSEKFKEAKYISIDQSKDFNPIFNIPCDLIFACDSRNELGIIDAQNIIKNNVKCILEGYHLALTMDAINLLIEKNIIFAPEKVCASGNTIISSFELSQNSMNLSWTTEQIEHYLEKVMANIHDKTINAARQFGKNDFFHGANIYGFSRVADAMIDQGII